MKKFLVNYLAPAEAMAGMANMTPEQKAEGMKPWMAWSQTMGSKLLDLGSPLMGATQIDSNASISQKHTEVTGYSIIEAADLEEAKSLLKDHPHLKWTDGVAIHIYECMSM